MTEWTFLLTRETVLLERYFRVLGYRHMFGRLSAVHVKNLFVLNKDGLTSLYINPQETENRRHLVFCDYEKGSLERFIPFWEEVLQNLKISAQQVLLLPTLKNFKTFVTYYKLSRAIVFYTEDLTRALGAKNIHAGIDKIALWHERAEVEACASWDSLLPFFQKIAEMYGLIAGELMFYKPHEFFALLGRHKTVGRDILQARKKSYVLCLKDERISFYVGNKADAVALHSLPPENVSLLGDIKGMVASPGFVQGYVRIVNTNDQMRKMQPGEILVSLMTTPRLISAVKKAAAIVTDEGGMTSHAAIVSREFHIPCIVGTRIASRVLKDGDFVEVDAHTGIVTKIEKK